MTEKEEVDKELLNYYSQNTTIHASLIVAIIFGLFSVLGIALNVGIIRRWLFLLPVYIGLGMLGDYEIERYMYYGIRAKKLADQLFNKKLKPKETEKTRLHWVFVHARLAYFLFLLASFLGVYGLDILNFFVT